MGQYLRTAETQGLEASAGPKLSNRKLWEKLVHAGAAMFWKVLAASQLKACGHSRGRHSGFKGKPGSISDSTPCQRGDQVKRRYFTCAAAHRPPCVPTAVLSWNVLGKGRVHSSFLFGVSADQSQSIHQTLLSNVRESQDVIPSGDQGRCNLPRISQVFIWLARR